MEAGESLRIDGREIHFTPLHVQPVGFVRAERRKAATQGMAALVIALTAEGAPVIGYLGGDEFGCEAR